MRLVLDTNTVVSGLLWAGAPRHLLDAARAGQVTLHTTLVLLTELDDVLRRPKFATRLNAAGVTAPTLVVGYAALATLVAPAPIAPVVLADPDDDAVLACAVSQQSEQNEDGGQPLLTIDEQIFGDAFGHRGNGHRHNRADEVIARFVTITEGHKIAPQVAPLLLPPAIGTLEQWHHILLRPFDNGLKIGFGCFHRYLLSKGGS